MDIASGGLFKAKVEGEFRGKFCEDCGTKLEKATIQMHGKEKIIMKCPKCGGSKGVLIARSVAIEAPAPMNCYRFSCFIKFCLRGLSCWLLSIYHNKRFNYAQKHKYENIPMSYRTGDNSPSSIKGLVLGIVKLSLISIRR